jgi:murein DD-endopeptidase MepM/ murein hydrolase activator NlpD
MMRGYMPQQWWRLACTALLMCMAISSCLSPEQAKFLTQVAVVGQTAAAIMETAGPPAQTQMAQAAQTAVAMVETVGPPVQTQIAQLATEAAKQTQPAVQTTLFELPHSDYEIASLCDYGSTTCADPGNYHTGVDSYGDIDILAAGPGFVMKIQPNDVGCNEAIRGDCDDHGLGNAIIIEHMLADGSKIYSLYAHLNKIGDGITVGQCLQKGDSIGTMGASGYGKQDRWGKRPHLHIEFKTKPVLGDPKSNGSTYFGYIKKQEADPNPDSWGYSDPNLYFGNVLTVVCQSSP